jgi:UDP-glucose 4-epimerase
LGRHLADAECSGSDAPDWSHSHILHVSSGLYGEAPTVDFPENYGPCIPISTYGTSKLASESLIAAYCHMFGLVARVFRLANVVGPRQTHGVGYDFVRRLKADPTRLRISGDRTQKKSYIYVEDVLNGILVVTDRTTARYDAFNVATDDYITVIEIAKLAAQICGVDERKVKFEFTGSESTGRGHRTGREHPRPLRDLSNPARSLGF